MDMATFTTEMEELSQACKQYLASNLDEKKTENWLIEPLIADLGFNTHSPEVVPEYKAGVRADYDHMVDYALFTNITNPSPVAIIECKALGVDIDKNDIRMQLRQYFQGTESEHTHIAILTNGNRFLFFTDSEKPNLMDTDPYWEFNLPNISDEDIEELAAYSKDCINSTASHLKDRIGHLKVRRFAKELKENLDRGFIPTWLIEATENELKDCLNCRLTSGTKQKLEPEVKNIWKEIWMSPESNKPKEKTMNHGQILNCDAQTEGMITLTSLMKDKNTSNIKIESYKLGSNPEVTVKNKTVSSLMLSCIADLENESGLLSKFGSELTFASKEKPKHSNHFIEGWFIDTNTPTARKMLQIKEALEKVGRNPNELQIKICVA